MAMLVPRQAHHTCIFDLNGQCIFEHPTKTVQSMIVHCTCCDRGICAYCQFGCICDNDGICAVCEHRTDRKWSGNGPVFTALYTGPCKRCGYIIEQGEDAQFVDDLFGHPEGQCGPYAIEGNLSDGIQLTTRERTLDMRYAGKPEIDKQVEAAELRLDRLYAQRELVERLGTDEDYEDGSILVIDVDGYTYVAFKAGLNWYTTSKTSSVMRWNSLVVNLLMRADAVHLVTEVEEL